MNRIIKVLKTKDWNIKKIGEVAFLSSGTTPSRKKEDLYFKNGEIPWVKTGDLNNSYIKKTEEKVTFSALNLSALKIFPINTVLLAMYGGFNQIGRTGILKIEATTNQAITSILIKDQSLLMPFFLQTWLNFRVNDWKQLAGSSRKDPNITKKDIENLYIPIPPIAEQKKIAEILETCDRQIELTEKLINAKRKLKQGLMQKLLTGKLRFSEFENQEWKTYKLSELANVERGKFTARPRNDPKYYGGNIPFIQTGDVTNSNGRISSYSQTLNREGLKVSKLFRKGSIVITIAANIGDVAILDIDVACPDSIVVVQAKPNICEDWLFYYLSSCKQIMENAATQNAQKNINLQVLRPLTIFTPSFHEQRKISETIKNYDSHIIKLNQIKTLYKTIKQGLMQQLLTGKTRVNVTP